jgi:hypothetical protein
MESVNIFYLISLAVAAGFFFLVYRAFVGMFGGRGKVGPKGMIVCADCGVRGDPATNTRGSVWIELVLWLCFIVPGLVYSLWRLTSRQKVCPECRSSNLVPVNSPRGKKLLVEFGDK